ncbi:MAG TPA: phosphatidate cytidylyltransferase, partial [bacterium]|nr:phosphatidate cytidylyltransferase [bacterium]
MSTLPRVITAVVFIPILILLSRVGGPWFLALIAGILILGLFEFYTMMEAKGVNPSKKTGIVVGVLLCLTTYATGADHLGFFLAALMIAITLRELFRSPATFPIYDISTTVFGVIYVGWLMTHLVLLRESPHELGLPYGIGSAFLLYS